MKISVICSTVRLGGLDLLFNSLEAQAFLAEDYEIILVDSWYEERKDPVSKASKRINVNLVHIPPKHNHGYYDDNTGWNTGLAVASGELVMFQVDYSWLAKNCLAAHWGVYVNNRGFTLTGVVDRMPYPALKPVAELAPEHSWWSVFKTEMTSGVADTFFTLVEPLYRERKGQNSDQDPSKVYELPGDKFYAALNESIPMKILKELNGWDERQDGGYGSNDILMGMKANLVGHKFMVAPALVNWKFGQPNTAQNWIPGKYKKKVRQPEDNYRFYEDTIQRIKDGKESVRTPLGWGAW